MKKRVLFSLAAVLCLLLCVLLAACAGEDVSQTVHSDSVGLLAVPEQTQPLRDINLKVDVTELARPYNGSPVNYPSYTADIAEPRVDFIWYKKAGKEYRQITERPTFVGDYRVTVYVVDGMEYTGEDTVDFSITPADFKPIANGEFPYTGASVFTVDAVPACGEDRIGFEVAFANGNVGAQISYIRFYGDNAENYRMDPSYTAQILPARIDLSHLSALAVQKRYDGTDLIPYTFDHTALSSILPGESATVLFSTGISDACTDAVQKGRVVRCENPNYVFTGEPTLSLKIEKALFAPVAELPYWGSDTVKLELPTGIGTDTIQVTLVFDSANVGAALLAESTRLAGEKAGNYTLAQTDGVRIVPRVFDIAALNGLCAQKRFDGTDRLSVTLNADMLAGIAAGQELVLTGTVPQIMPCAEQELTFLVSEVSNPNYTVAREFKVRLTVQKALLTFSGAPALSYNGYSERVLSADASFMSGLAQGYPIGMIAVFADAAVGSDFLRVVLYGENLQYYEVDDSDFAPVIAPAALRFNATSVTFAANGEDTRVLRGARSPLLTAIAHGDEVFALLTFNSAEAGATLVDVTLYGADAYKYALNISDFTATIQ